MNFDGNFAQAHFGGRLLVHKAGADQPHDLLFALAKLAELRSKVGGLCFLLAPRAVGIEC